MPPVASRVPPPDPRRGITKWWGVPLVSIAIVALVGVIALALLPAQLVAHKAVANAEGREDEVATPYALVPAGAQPVADRVSYGDLGADINVDTDPEGRVYFLTISEPPQSMLGWWIAQDEPEIEFTTDEEKFGAQTPSQQRSISLQMMRTSGQVAQYVALTRAGYDAEIIPGPVQVQQMLCLDVAGNRCLEYVPTAEQLDDGDMILAVDGVEVTNLDDLDAQLADNRPGDRVTLELDRIDSGEVTVDVTLLRASDDPDDPEYDRPLIGFVPFDTDTVDLPFEIAFDTGDIGGPSAGLAFTLTLIDELTDGDLLGGLDVAVTGTIALNGTVGAIGGLPQKASAVRQAGLRYLLVPASQPAETIEAARQIAGESVAIIPVSTVDEALAALVELGGDPVAA